MKSKFYEPFRLDRGIGKDTWVMSAPLRYYSETFSRELVVPNGFPTDFASIPTFFHRLLPKNGIYDAAAVLHDWLYATGEYYKDTADNIFLEAMVALNVESWRRNAMYQAVDKFGGTAWRNHRKTTRSNHVL